MTEIYIAKDKLPEVIGKLMKEHRVFGPVFQGQYHEHTELTKSDELDLGYQNTRLSRRASFTPIPNECFSFPSPKVILKPEL